MKWCRVASRVASIAPAHIACIQGESTPTIAAKVSLSSLLLFLPGGGRPGRRARPPGRRPRVVVRSLPGGLLSAAVGLPDVSVVDRRVASKLTPAPTPSLHSATAANERGRGHGGEW